jgi:RNA polymerase sigma-70 factor (ECF subfamily)
VKLIGTRRSDHELLERSRAGDVEAFDRFYRRHRDLVLTFCAHRVRSAELAADLMAETFAAALAAVHERERSLPDTPVAWLFGIAQHKVADSFRRGRVEDEARRRLGLEPLVLDDADLGRVSEIVGRTDLAESLMRRLPREQAEAIHARIVDERPYPEIARALQCSEVVVRKRVSRGLKTLRTSVEDRDSIGERA